MARNSLCSTSIGYEANKLKALFSEGYIDLHQECPVVRIFNVVFGKPAISRFRWLANTG